MTSLISEGLATAHFIYAQCLFLGQGATKDVDRAAIEYTKVNINTHYIFFSDYFMTGNTS